MPSPVAPYRNPIWGRVKPPRLSTLWKRIQMPTKSRLEMTKAPTVIIQNDVR